MLHVVLKSYGRELAIQGQGPDIRNFLAVMEGPAQPSEAGSRGGGDGQRDRDVGREASEGTQGAGRWFSGRDAGGRSWSGSRET